jgi:eukaryotic-like serine/threonine-protein kinase
VIQQWYVDAGGRADGPLSASELRLRATDGRLSPKDRVSTDGRRWAAAEKVRGLRFPTDSPTEPAEILPPANTAPAVADSLPGYSLHAVIGTGACGVVYRATQLRLDRVVALKTIELESSTSATKLARFDREAVALAKLQHPNIVGVHDCGRHHGRGYIAMELLDGEDLEQRLLRLGRLDERTAWTIVRQTANALAHAAKLGITHRDIKPANLFLVRPPSGFGLPEDLPMVKVMDFGLAFMKQADLTDDGGRLTRVGAVVGTPAYMAPEQFARSNVDHRADIYALGTTAYHALAGTPPFDGETVWDIMVRKNQSAPQLRHPVSAESARLVAEMLVPDPDQRIADYDELIRRIDALPALKAETNVAPKPATHSRRTVRNAIIGGAITLIGMAAVLALTWNGSGPRTATGPAPAVVVSGRSEMLSDRANFPAWDVEGKVAYEPDGDGVPVLTSSGAIRWTYLPTETDRLSIGLDPFRAETADLLFGDGLVLRISRTNGVSAGTSTSDGQFRPLTATIPFPTPESREGLVPYLSIEIQRVGDRWDIWFDHRHVGGIRSHPPGPSERIQLRTDGRSTRVERVELERLQPAEVR